MRPFAKAQAEIEESRSRYAYLYDYALVAFLTFDRKGLILEANPASVRMLGVERKTLLRRPFVHFVSPESRKAFYLHLERAVSNGCKESCELNSSEGR